MIHKIMGIEIIAKTPPAICIAGGIIFLLMGNAGTGWGLIILGVVLQILWLKFG
jgi:hypothetical protein